MPGQGSLSRNRCPLLSQALAFTGLLFWLCFGPYACSHQRNDGCSAEEDLQAALALLRTSKRDQAYTAFQRIVEKCPSSAEAHVQMGSIDYMRGNYPLAEYHFSGATRLASSDPNAWFRLGESLMKLRRFQEAANAYGRAYQLDEDPLNMERHGRAILLGGDVPKARQVFEDLVRLYPTSHGGFFFLANICRSQGDRERAARYYQEAMELQPAMVEAYVNLAEIQYQEARYADAAALLEGVLKEVPHDAPSDPKVRFNLGLVYLTLGDSDKMVENFEAFLRLDPAGEGADRVRKILAGLESPTEEKEVEGDSGRSTR